MSRNARFDGIRYRWRWLESALGRGRRVVRADLEKYLANVKQPIPAALQLYAERASRRGRGRPFKRWTEKDVFVRNMAVRWYRYFLEIARGEQEPDADYERALSHLKKMQSGNLVAKPSTIAGQATCAAILAHFHVAIGRKTVEQWVTESNTRLSKARRRP